MINITTNQDGTEATLALGEKANWVMHYEYKDGLYGLHREGGRGAEYTARCEIYDTHPIFIVRDARGKEVDRFTSGKIYTKRVA